MDAKDVGRETRVIGKSVGVSLYLWKAKRNPKFCPKLAFAWWLYVIAVSNTNMSNMADDCGLFENDATERITQGLWIPLSPGDSWRNGVDKF